MSKSLSFVVTVEFMSPPAENKRSLIAQKVLNALSHHNFTDEIASYDPRMVAVKDEVTGETIRTGIDY